MAMFTWCVVSGTGFAALFAYVEANPKLQWRWIGWIQLSESGPVMTGPKLMSTVMVGVYFVICLLIIGETRAPVLLRRRAKKLREERGMDDGGRYTHKSEVDKPALSAALKISLKRPISTSELETERPF